MSLPVFLGKISDEKTLIGCNVNGSCPRQKFSRCLDGEVSGAFSRRSKRIPASHNSPVATARIASHISAYSSHISPLEMVAAHSDLQCGSS